MENIIFKGEEFKDVLHITTTVKISFWGRVQNLFCPEIVFGHEVYVKEVEMPPYKVEPKIYSVSYWRKIVSWYHRKKGYGEMEAPKN